MKSPSARRELEAYRQGSPGMRTGRIAFVAAFCLFGEVRVSSDGTGEGKLVPAAKVSVDKQTRLVEIEGYAAEPVRLTSTSSDAMAALETSTRTEPS